MNALNTFLTATVSLALLGAAYAAPEKEKNGSKGRRTLTFQPGAKTPDKGAENSADNTPVAPAVAVAAPAATAVAAAAAAASGQDEPGQITASFFALVQQGKVDEAYAALMKGSKIAERAEEVRLLKSKTQEAIQIFGAITGHELIESKAVGSNLLRRTYLTLGGEFPLRWRFYFYRSGGQWRLVDLRVDDRLAGIFDEGEESSRGAAPAAETKQ